MSIDITGDTHAPIDVRKLTSENFPRGRKLTKKDHVIVTGDFGFFWNGDASEIWWREWLEERPWTTLFLDGNHENFDMLESYPTSERFGGRVSVLSDSIIWLRRGEVYTIDGLKFFTFGGAESHDGRIGHPERGWWPQEVPNNQDIENGIKNLDKHNWEVDIVLSHTCPRTEMHRFIPPQFINEYSQDPTTKMLDEFKERLSFQQWFFGHFHLDDAKGKFRALFDDIVEIG